MATGYIIAHADTTCPAQYAEYRRWSTKAIKAHGAEVCVRDAKAAVLKGDGAPTQVTTLQLACVAASHGLPKYRKAHQVRKAAVSPHAHDLRGRGVTL